MTFVPSSLSNKIVMPSTTLSYWQWLFAGPWRRRETKKYGVGVVVLAIVAAIGAGLADSIKDGVKSLASRTMTWGQTWIEEIFPPELPQADKNAALSILLAQLEGDRSARQTKHVR